MVFFLDSSADGTKSFTSLSQGWGEGGGNFATDSRGEFAASAVGGYADLEGAVGVCGEEGEGTESRGVGDVYGNAASSAEGRNVCAYSMSANSSFIGDCLHTQWISRSRSDENRINNTIDVPPSKSQHIFIFERLLQPFYLAVVYPLLQGVM